MNSEVKIYDYSVGELFLGLTTSSSLLKMIIVDGYEFSAEHKNFDDVSSFEVSGSGYDAGGKICQIVSSFDANGTIFTIQPVQWLNSTILSSTGAVVYNSENGSLLFYVHFQAPATSIQNIFEVYGGIRIDL